LRNDTLRIMPIHSSSDDAIGREPPAWPEPPRSEPEIIPPGADFRSRPGGKAVFYTHNGTRIHVTRLGPLGVATVLLGVGVLGALGVLMLLGTVLIAAAAAGAIVMCALVVKLLRALVR
jgi:hypothetical protein